MRKNGRNGADDVVTRPQWRCEGFSLLQNIQTDSGAHPASLMDNGVSFLGAKLAGE
jgi:hypothetical protein